MPKSKTQKAEAKSTAPKETAAPETPQQKSTKSEAAKSPKTDKSEKGFSRMRAMSLAIATCAGKTTTVEQLLKQADVLYSEQHPGAEANPKENMKGFVGVRNVLGPLGFVIVSGSDVSISKSVASALKR